MGMPEGYSEQQLLNNNEEEPLNRGCAWMCISLFQFTRAISQSSCPHENLANVVINGKTRRAYFTLLYNS